MRRVAFYSEAGLQGARCAINILIDVLDSSRIGELEVEAERRQALAATVEGSHTSHILQCLSAEYLAKAGDLWAPIRSEA